MHSEIICAAPLALEIVWDRDKVKFLHLHWSKDVTESKELSPKAAELQNALEAYMQRKPVLWPDLPFDMDRLSDFSARALKALRTVPAGRFVTYGELAKMAGSPKGARAAGRAMATNPWPLVYPCHRVLGANRKLTGFSGSGGVEMKKYLLELEGAL